MLTKIDKNLIFLFMGRLTQAVIAILTIRMMTELLNQNEVGNQYVVNSMILWFSLVLINPIGMFVNRHVHEWQKKSHFMAAIHKLNGYFLTVAILGMPILFLAKEGLGFGTEIKTPLLFVYVGLYIFFSTWFQTLASFFNLFEYQKQFVFLNVLSQVAGLVFAIISVKFLEPTGLCWLAGLLAGQGLALACGVYLFRKYFLNHGQPQPGPKFKLITLETLYFCYPVALATLFMWFMTQGYRLYIERYLGVQALASLGIGLGIAASVSGLVEALTTQYFFPKFYSSIADSTIEQRQSAWTTLWTNAALIYIPLCFLTMASAPFLVKFLTASQFHHVIEFVLFGAGIELFRQLSNIAYIASHAEKKTKNTIVPYLLGALTLFGLIASLQHFGRLNVHNVLLSLLLSGLVTLVANLCSIRAVMKARYNMVSLLASFALAAPVVSVLFFIQVEDATWKLFLISSVCGIYCLGLIWKTIKV